MRDSIKERKTGKHFTTMFAQHIYIDHDLLEFLRRTLRMQEGLISKKNFEDARRSTELSDASLVPDRTAFTIAHMISRHNCPEPSRAEREIRSCALNERLSF
jgi:hypothetical protein